MSKLLIATVGLPRSGKTTWVQQRRAHYGWPVVSPDAIRLVITGQRYFFGAEPHVWATAKTMVPALFLAGHDTILVDVTNTTIGQRKQWMSKEWDTVFKVFETPIEICKERALATQQEDLIAIIDRMYLTWEPLAEDETECSIS